MMKQILLVAGLLLAMVASAKQDITLSPDGRTSVKVNVDKTTINYEVSYDNKVLILPSEIGINIMVEGKDIGNWVLRKTGKQSINTIINPPVKEKRAVIPDVYNQTVFSFKNGVALEFRVYNDGVAYRYISNIAKDIVVNEQVSFKLNPNATLHYSHSVKRPDVDIFHSPFEEPYFKSKIDTFSTDIHAFTPLLVCTDNMPKMLLTESDIIDYPGMFLVRGKGAELVSKFPGYPLKEKIFGDEFKQKLVVERADYIAKTNGMRTFPWRVAAICPTDADLLMNDIVYRLAKAPAYTDFSWIKPGKSTEEWITGLNLYGVDFKSGLNTETYKYYIDFAARFGLEYVMLDAGWSNVDDVFDITPGMDIKEIVRYAKEKNVDLIFWTLALTMDKQMDKALIWFKELGVKIVMIDFFDRNDQLTMNFMHRFAEECAKKELMCMIHGSPAPFGFSRTHPHMLTREGVLGSEYNLWSTKANPDYDLTVPFIRTAAGPMDYEPGQLQNATKSNVSKGGFERVVAQGTRIHQMAMFVVYESPLQLFSGNLSDAFREPELMTFMGKIPTVWDETRIINAEFGKVIVEARRLKDKWFLAAINNWEPAEFTVSLDFLPEGEYRMEEAVDGINADKNPHDYKIRSSKVTSKSSIKIKLAPGGGFVAQIEK